MSRSTKEFSCLLFLKSNSFYCSRNEHKQGGQHLLEAEASNLPSHRSTIVPQSVFPVAAAFHFFNPFFFKTHLFGVFLFFLSPLSEHLNSKMYTVGDLSRDIFWFLLLTPGDPPAETPSPGLPCTVVEQRVLTARTTALSHPRVSANPRGTAAVAKNDCLQLYMVI